MKTLERPGEDTRQYLADVLCEEVNARRVEPELADEIVTRLLPELYPEVAEWNQKPMSASETRSCDQALAQLVDIERLTDCQANIARAYLGIGHIAAAS